MRWIQQVFGRRAYERKLASELTFHLEQQIKDNLAAGMSPERARVEATHLFGGLDQVKEECRDERRWVWLERWGKDVSFAVRSLRRSPGFTSVVILTLALGIGANTAVFTAVNALMLRPLPIREPERFVLLTAAGPVEPNQKFPYPLFDKKGNNNAFPYPFYELFREETQTLANVVAVGGWVMSRSMVATGFGGKAEESITAEEVSGNYFPTLGVSTVIGRPLDVSDDRLGATEPAVVISHEFWRRRFNGDPTVIGKTLRLDNVSVTIVGVVVSGFSGVQVGIKPDLWFPIRLAPLLDRNLPWGTDANIFETLPWIHILGRLQPGVSSAQAAAELDRLFQFKLAQMDPRRQGRPSEKLRQDLATQRIDVVPAGTGYAGLRSKYKEPLFALMIIVGVMQLVACANVAGLLLARGAARSQELALRSALGARRCWLVGQLLTESLLLAALAAFTGVLLAEGSTRFLANYVGGLDLWADRRVLLFAFAATIVTAIVFGLVPALRLSRRELIGSLKGQIPGGRQRLKFALVITQIGFAFVLLAVAGLFARTLRNLSSIETGFQDSDRQLFDLNLTPDIKPQDRPSLYHRLTAAAEALPGVESVTAYQGVDLLGDTAFAEAFSVPGYTPAREETLESVNVIVGPRFFETMGIPLVRGRDFGLREEDTRSHGAPAIVISKWSARKLFGEADPIGRRIKLDVEFEIVGVAEDIKYSSLREAPRFVFYLPLVQRPNMFRTTFAVKTTGSIASLGTSLRNVVAQIDPQAHMSGLRTIDEKLDQALSSERLIAHLAGFFGLAALVLSSMGLFGLMSYNVSARTQEIGIRMALGASLRRVLFQILQQGFFVALVGCVVGIGGACAVTRLAASLLYGVSSIDWLTFTAAAILLLMVTLLACAIPAWRASMVNPAVALRAE